MKDYYTILGVPEDADARKIKAAFRKLAFRHHPDKNPGQEAAAEAKFKEINEAYGVLGDRARRADYDRFRKSGFAGARSGFDYSQQDIFRTAFSSAQAMDELRRMFAQGGLRFDQDFMNGIFFQGAAAGGSTTSRPGWPTRQLLRLAKWAGGKLLRSLVAPAPSLDRERELPISASEARGGGEKTVTVSRDGKRQRLAVKIPAGIKNGARIRLRGMGHANGGRRGDLYLRVRHGDR